MYMYIYVKCARVCARVYERVRVRVRVRTHQENYVRMCMCA